MLKNSISSLSSLILFSLYSSSALAVNDWYKPCFTGTCSYDLPDNPSGPSGTLKIWGSNTSIADITTAGGWEIIGCDPNEQEQDIRIVCRGGIDIDEDGDNDGCSHLFASGLRGSPGVNETNVTTPLTTLPVPTGAVVDDGDNSTSTDEDQRANGKIVRLPEQCGKQAFARIAKAWTHENQTVPSHISKRLAPFHRRTQHHHKVKGLTIDTQFHKSNSAQHGAVNFAIVGANVPGAKAPSSSAVSSKMRNSGYSEKKRNFVYSRAFSQRRGFGDSIDNVIDAIGDGAEAVGGAISDGATAVGSAISDDVGAVGDALTGEKHFNNSISAPINISQAFTLFDQNIQCTNQLKTGANGSSITPTTAANGQMKVDVEAGINGAVNIVVAASGSLTDLRVDSFDLTTTLNADLNGAVVLSAGVGGSIDSGKIKFFEVGIPGFDFPGIFSVGPTFQINGEAKVSLNVDTDMRIGIVYHIADLEVDFPNGRNKSGTFNPRDTPLQLSAQPSAEATGKVEAHLIPVLSVGINAFEGATKAEVFVDLDASASMTLTADAALPSGQLNVTLREEKPTVELQGLGIRGGGPMGAYYWKKRSSEPESGPMATASSTSSAPKSSDSVVVNNQTKFGGCVEIDAGLVANVGADADFFGLFNPSETIPLFQKQFSLFKKCFGDKKKRRSMSDIGSRHLVLAGRDLQCNGGNGSATVLEQLADEIVSALNIHTIA